MSSFFCSCAGDKADEVVEPGDLAEEDQKRLEELYVTAPGGTTVPRAWSGWNAGRQFEDRRRKIGEDEVSSATFMGLNAS